MRRDGAISELGEGEENKGPPDAGLFERITDRLRKVVGDHSRVSHHAERFPFGVETAHSAFPVLAAAVDAESSTILLNGSADDQSGAVLAANFKHRNLLVLPTIILWSTSTSMHDVSMRAVIFATSRVERLGVRSKCKDR
jgi:hypothetical protein